ncbi:hypothetical protein DPMN_159296 [Dreissena polymorpha]|uniref:Uncharacterized protein n=1 Tax=Dreissena polymorpha TaxID=45954 RepID=A0A9D4EN34_DREPO|nr:hypothetical protein DPMN_159296 [Dreissena polymorpha]
MEEFTHLTDTTGIQHKGSTEARIKRDESDLEEMQTHMINCTPYTTDPTLKTLSIR